MQRGRGQGEPYTFKTVKSYRESSYSASRSGGEEIGDMVLEDTLKEAGLRFA